MRVAISGEFRRNLLRGAAIVLLGGLASGCSSDVMRFQDSILTGSSHRTQAAAPAVQPYPGDVAGLDTTYTGSVNRRAVRPMNVASRVRNLPTPSATVGGAASLQVAAAPAAGSFVSNPVQLAPPVTSRALAPIGADLDTNVTGTVAQQQPAPIAAADVAPNGDGGWGGGGSTITVQPGETVYNLSRRYGVPVDAIMSANGLSDANKLAAGQQLVIPSYTYSAEAPVSAPDNNPKVAAAEPTAGGNGAPAPADPPVEKVAVLPQQPKLREKADSEQASATAPNNAVADGRSYTVVAGDTLNGISARVGVSPDALKEANGLASGLIRIGQTLIIPDGGGASSKLASAPPAELDDTSTGSTSADEPKVAAYTPPATDGDLVKNASLKTTAAAPDSTGIESMRWPVRGRIIAPFGGTVGGKPNDGIDISVPEGTPVKAAENGVVIFAGDGLKDFGNTVLVRHEGGLVTVYGHASELTVERGDKVRRGQEIARSGMSGSAESPKLHFEVRKDSAPVNPVSYLE